MGLGRYHDPNNPHCSSIKLKIDAEEKRASPIAVKLFLIETNGRAVSLIVTVGTYLLPWGGERPSFGGRTAFIIYCLLADGRARRRSFILSSRFSQEESGSSERV